MRKANPGVVPVIEHFQASRRFKKAVNEALPAAAAEVHAGSLKCLIAENHLQEIITAIPAEGRMLEWGCGGQTLRFLTGLAAGQSLESVEHNPQSAARVRAAVSQDQAVKWKLHIAKVDPGRVGKTSTPFEESPAGLHHYLQPPQVDFSTIDVFFVDGIARGACLATLAAMPRTRPVTIFLHDTRRDWYLWAMKLFHREWERIAPVGYPAELAKLVLEANVTTDSAAPNSGNGDSNGMALANEQQEARPKGSPDPFATHLEILTTAAVRSGLLWPQSPVLELGCGEYSTPLLARVASAQDRSLRVITSSASWASRFNYLSGSRVQFERIPFASWPTVDLSAGWGMAFVDNEQFVKDRYHQVLRLANLANVVVVHDSNRFSREQWAELAQHYRYLFKHQRLVPNTAIFSNHVDPQAWFAT